MKQRYIKVNHELIPVTEEVYKAFTRPNERERFSARRDGKCGQSNYQLCQLPVAAGRTSLHIYA